MSRLLFLGLLLLVACQKETPIDEQPVEAKEEVLLYIASRGEGFDIYRNTSIGLKEEQLTTAPGWEWAPQVVLAEGRIIYNSQDTSGNFSQRAMNLQGEELEFRGIDLSGFTIAPSGDRIAYTVERDGGTQLMIASYPAVADSAQITRRPNYHGRPCWSPDGTKLAYISDQSGSNEIYVYDLTDKRHERLTNNQLREKYLSWSPDGQQLATSMQQDTLAADLFIIGLTDQSVTQITETPIDESEIAWSPLGGFMAYHAEVEGADDIYVLDLQTGGVKRVTKADGYHGEPCWALE